MRAHPLRLAFGGIAFAALLSLTACVPSADKKTSDTLAPLVLPPVTGSSVLVPGTEGTATTVTLDQSSVVTLATVATTPPAATTATTPSAGGSPTTTVGTVAPNSTPGSYTVVSKDTLSGIARRCAITPQSLADYNTWSDGIAHPIYPGDVVKLPCTPAASTAGGATTTTVKGTTATTVKGAATTTTTITPGPGGTYVVVAGDYLAGIAAKTGTTVDAIVAVNGWPDGAKHLIVAGQQIKLPAK